eukprot:1729639-Heterocapsa_arctica.AAC.1
MNQDQEPDYTPTHTHNHDDDNNHTSIPQLDDTNNEMVTGENCCVDGACLVSMHPTGQTMICELTKGVNTLAHNGTGATVLCVILTTGFRGDIPLVHLPGGCRITTGHPVRINTITAGHQICSLQGRDHEHQTDWLKPNKIAIHRMTACTTL